MSAAEGTAGRDIVNSRVIAASREAIWDAIRDPQRLARWWGPAGFTNRFLTHEFRTGGEWKHVMRGPDGTEYPNEARFVEIDRPARVIIEHVSAPHFVLDIALTEEAGGTRVHWRQRFDTAQVRDQLAKVCEPANEQNLDRLEAELARIPGATMSRQMFVNLAVREMERTKAFFSSLGFSFNPQFTNDQGACMVIGENNFVMLLVEPFFRNFTKKPIADATQTTEVLVCLSCTSRAEVDELVRKALAAGGTAPQPPQDHGFMYGHGFTDLDGHMWELMYMDPNAAPPHG